METDTIGALQAFLTYGPIGLAGLMLVLVIIGLNIGELTVVKASLLRTFLFVGAVCFLAALGAQMFVPDDEYDMRLVVAPQDFGDDATSEFPPPIIRINGQKVLRAEDTAFKISHNVSVLVDVTNAVGEFRVIEKTALEKSTALDETRAELDAQIQKLESANKRAVEQGQALAEVRSTLEAQRAAVEAARRQTDEIAQQVAAIKSAAAGPQNEPGEIRALTIEVERSLQSVGQSLMAR